MQRHSLLQNFGEHRELSNSTVRQDQSGTALLDMVRGLIPPTHRTQLKLIFNQKIKRRHSIKKKQDENNNLSQRNQMTANSKPAREKSSHKKADSCRKKEMISRKNERKQKRGPPYRPIVLSQKQLFGSSKKPNNNRHIKSSRLLAGKKNLLILKKMRQCITQTCKNVERSQSKGLLMQDSSHLHLKMEDRKANQVFLSDVHKEHHYSGTKHQERQEIKTEIQYKGAEHAEKISFLQKFRFKHRHNSSRKHKKSLQSANNHPSASKISQLKPMADGIHNIRPVIKAQTHPDSNHHNQALSRRPQPDSQQVRKGETRLKKWNH